LFESYLGQDESDSPRVLLEYQIVSSKFTSVIKNIKLLGKEALAALENKKPPNSEEIRIQNTDVSQVIEF
jgi:hypothetical protein